MPVTELTIDEAVLRSKESPEEFPPDIPDSAKDGTRRNMLSGALLDGEHYPQIVLRSERLEQAPDGAGAQWTAHVQVTVRDRTSLVVVPVHYEQHDDQIVVRHDIARRTQAVSVEDCSDSHSIGKGHGGRPIPRLHQTGVVLVERLLRRAHLFVFVPCFRYEHHHHMG